MPIEAGECKGGHSCKGIFIPAGTPLVGGPHNKEVIENERFMADGASGLQIIIKEKVAVYHPWPCDDGSRCVSLHYIDKGNL